MNFLLRTTQNVPAEKPSVHETPPDTHYTSKSSETTLEGLIADDPYSQFSVVEDHDADIDAVGGDNGSISDQNGKNDEVGVMKHSDVSEEEGCITIPCKELPDNWNDAPDIYTLRSLDRSFVFPGEQVHILACLSAYKQNTEIITPFKVAAVMSKNGIRQSPKKQNGNMGDERILVDHKGDMSPSQDTDQNGENQSSENIDPQKDFSASESLRMEDLKRQTELLLKRFENSHFFVRIAESSKPLWSKKGFSSTSPESSENDGQMSSEDRTKKNTTGMYQINAMVDRGNFNANVSGGVARNTVKCCSLPNGDIVVLLKVNVGVDFLRDPVIEILQFEKYQERNLSSENQDSKLSFENQDIVGYSNPDPCAELLKWLLPLDNTIPPPARSLSPPRLTPNSGIGGSASQKPAFSSSSSSQLLFSHFRSYSMSSLPQSAAPSPSSFKTTSSKPNVELEDWDQFSSQKFSRGEKMESEELLSFRGVSLERERFSVCCGLEGIYRPGRRWRRKLEIIQPVEIKSFAAVCNTDDLLCVQIKNVSPAHVPDIVVYIDAITIVFEEASKGGPPSSLPIACIEAGNEQNLPNLALRKGEEHSFILKPATSMWRNLKSYGDRKSQSFQSKSGNAASSFPLSTKTVEGKRNATNTDSYAIVVSCRCNYSESRLFFKQPTSWQPRIARDLMISVAWSGRSPKSNGIASQLPVQVLTLQASNLTSEDLTLTVLAPASVISSPSVVSLVSASTSPMSPFVGFSEFTGKLGGDKHSMPMKRMSSVPSVPENQKYDVESGVRSVSFNDQSSPTSDVISSTGLGYLWLQSRVPLGCVPAQSVATIKLELLPLTDGIITLDTLQIYVKEKGVTYIPDHTLKINATSSISAEII